LKLARAIAFYLPQFHPIFENDQWWGKGFTEWTNTAKSKPLYKGHYQPHVPADLGFYDLRVPETRESQAKMAKEFGLEGFCYYHYWFGGKRLLERPFTEVLESGKPNFPFCLCWANQTWTGIWHGAPDRTLIEQTYPGAEDHRKHFFTLLKAFKDQRYITVDGKPLFLIHLPNEILEVEKFITLWREFAQECGLKGLHLVGATWNSFWIPQDHGFDASVTIRMPALRKKISLKKPIKWFFFQYQNKRNRPTIYSYKSILSRLLPEKELKNKEYPCVIPNWDNTPRSGKNGLVLNGSTPELFRIHFKTALKLLENYPTEQKLIFIKSWNEWAEGNHLEPDLKYGKQYLQVLRDELVG
jgi:lipopolysaccharide biosynthesis protein